MVKLTSSIETLRSCAMVGKAGKYMFEANPETVTVSERTSLNYWSFPTGGGSGHHKDYEGLLSSVENAVGLLRCCCRR